MVGLWEHSFGCGVVARLIAKKKGLKEPDEVSVAALLHDIGKVVIILQFPSEYEQAMKEAEAQGITILEAEKTLFDVTHANAGTWMTQKWSFPRNLVETIEYHHKPHLSKNVPLETAIVHVSDIIVRARAFGFAGDYSVPAINPAAWEKLDLSETDLKDVLAEMEEAIDGAGEMFLEQ